jgi:hypothetical protein
MEIHFGDDFEGHEESEAAAPRPGTARASPGPPARAEKRPSGQAPASPGSGFAGHGGSPRQCSPASRNRRRPWRFRPEAPARSGPSGARSRTAQPTPSHPASRRTGKSWRGRRSEPSGLADCGLILPESVHLWPRTSCLGGRAWESSGRYSSPSL